MCRLFRNVGISEPLQACTGIALACLAEGSQNGDDDGDDDDDAADDDDDDDDDDDEIKKGMIGNASACRSCHVQTEF
jgi:hypothetical protein